MFGYVILALVFLWGLLMILKPELLWQIEHSDTIGKNEPTERYVKGMRVGGVTCMVIAVFLAVFYFL